ncbi:hypothetical protein DAMA08_021550 [Martiniozyma asiatica (nom. inval.)]|nr:hypothetical protein DAMA08_021550 [Martiniozyma asiatica]
MSYYPETETLPPLGALCLDYTDDIHRPPGDAIVPESYKFPVIRQMVNNATLWNVVDGDSFSEEKLQAYVDACNKLEEKGCIGIITSCGFLAQIQSRLASRINIPVATSSLIQVPFILATMSPKKKVGVITFDPSVLSKTHFNGVGVTDELYSRVIVAGSKPNGPLQGIIVDGAPYVHEELEKEFVDIAKELVSSNKDIGAIVLECTQMPPFANAIQKAVGLPVYDAVTMIDWFYSGLHTRTLPEDANKEAGLRKRVRSEKEKK